MGSEAKTGDKPAPIEQGSEAAAPAPLRRDFIWHPEAHSVEPLDQAREGADG